MEKHDIVIIGGGPAGLAAACAAYDSGIRDILVLDREKQAGGILRQCIHSGFGLHKLGKELTGPEYAAHYEEMVKLRNIEVLCETTVIGVTKDRVVTAVNKNGVLEIQAKAVILAMGCRERSRGALNIAGSRPSGVYSAGTAQKLVNIEGYKVGKKAVILGSGDIGLIMARRMTLEGTKVEAVCEIMSYSGGLTRNIVQCLDDFGIPLYFNTTVAQIHGKDRLSGVTIAQVDENRHIIEETKRYIECDTLLLSVGLIPENELTKGAGIVIDPITSGAVVDQHRQTSVEGIFSCGNVLQVHDLVDYVSDEAEIAGKGAAMYVKGQLKTENTAVSIAGNGVRYLLPQSFGTDSESVSLFFRVTKPCGAVRIDVKCGETLLKSEKRIRAVPGEMEKITLKKAELEKIEKSVTVELEEI